MSDKATPWHIYGPHDDCIYNAEKDFIVEFPDSKLAELAVRAVNSHEALVEACVAFVYAETENHKYGEFADEIDGEMLAGLYDTASKLARSALALARGDE